MLFFFLLLVSIHIPFSFFSSIRNLYFKNLSLYFSWNKIRNLYGLMAINVNVPDQHQITQAACHLKFLLISAIFFYHGTPGLLFHLPFPLLWHKILFQKQPLLSTFVHESAFRTHKRSALSHKHSYSRAECFQTLGKVELFRKNVSCCVGGWLFFHGNKKDGHREKFFNNLVMICLCKAWIRRKSGMVRSVSSFSTLKYRFIFTVGLKKRSFTSLNLLLHWR